MKDLKQFLESHGLSGEESLKVHTAPVEGEKKVTEYMKLKELFEKYDEFKVAKTEEDGEADS